MPSLPKPRKRPRRFTVPQDFRMLFATHLRASLLLDEAVAAAEASRVAGNLDLARDQIEQAEALHLWLQQLEQRMRDIRSPLPRESHLLEAQAPRGSH